jgi:hypothetical protein
MLFFARRNAFNLLILKEICAKSHDKTEDTKFFLVITWVNGEIHITYIK